MPRLTASFGYRIGVWPGAWRGSHVLLAEDEPIKIANWCYPCCAVPAYSWKAVSRWTVWPQYRQCTKTTTPSLMDVQMPHVDSLQATRLLRTIAGVSLPIIAVTANEFEGDRQRCFEAGMTNSLAKPVVPQALVPIVMRRLTLGSAPLPGTEKAAANVSE